jgi:hypothetical protein
MSVRASQIKPNPAGKDRTRSGNASGTQLGGEWVDVRNSGNTGVNMNGVRLCHVAYSPDGRQSWWAEVISFTGTLGAGEVVRVHSGSGPLSALRPEDIAGAIHHLFTGKNYVWNNDKSDCSGLFVAGAQQPFDTACYEAYPPEGQILKRVGDKFVPAATAAYAR